jgi:hypothetical protein
VAGTLLVAACPPWAGAREQEPGPSGPAPRETFKVPKATSEIRVDGAVDEAAWAGALSVELRYEIEPGENTPPPVRTECLVTYDDRYLHVAFRAYDPEPASIQAHLSDRDTASRDDFVGFIVDTFDDERRGFQMFVNPLGVQMDASRNDVGGGDQSEDATWDAIWLSAGRITREGYEVEMAIPFTSLRFPATAGDRVWNFVPLRSYPRNVRHQITLRPMDRNRNCLFCQAPKLVGFAGITPGRNLELDPTLTSRHLEERDEAFGAPLRNRRIATLPGLSARWGVTPNLSLNAALNPDFSQVEADTAQLSINTRFTLFFPEKRPFFLEGADFFVTPLNVVYTRTVADPSWGAKVTGKQGRHALGAAFGRDNRTSLIFPANQESDDTSLAQENSVGVLRYRLDVGRNSTLGVLATDRQGEGYRNRIYGADGHLRVSGVDTLRFQFLRSESRYPDPLVLDFGQPAGDFSGSALAMRYIHEARDWFWLAAYDDLGRRFRADTGFIPRVDTRRAEGILERARWGKPGEALTRAIVGLWGSRTEDHDGLLTDQDFAVHTVLFGPRQSFLFARVAARKEYFEGVTYDQTTGEFESNIRPVGDFTLSLAGRFGDAVDYDNSRPGRLVRIRPGVLYDVGRGMHVQVDHTLERLTVAGGRLYEANLTQLRLVYQFSLRTFARAIVQRTSTRRDPSLYIDPVEPRDREVLKEFLFSYKVNPQTLIYAGYSDSRTTEDYIDYTLKDRALFVKLGYAWLL